MVLDGSLIVGSCTRTNDATRCDMIRTSLIGLVHTDISPHFSLHPQTSSHHVLSRSDALPPNFVSFFCLQRYTSFSSPHFDLQTASSFFGFGTYYLYQSFSPFRMQTVEHMKWNHVLTFCFLFVVIHRPPFPLVVILSYLGFRLSFLRSLYNSVSLVFR